MGALAEGDKSSKSLLANVLDKNDDYILPSNLHYGSVIDKHPGCIEEYGFTSCKHCSKYVNGCTLRNGVNVMQRPASILESQSPNIKNADYTIPYIKCNCSNLKESTLKKELEAILQEIQYITDKYRDEVTFCLCY